MYPPHLHVNSGQSSYLQKAQVSCIDMHSNCTVQVCILAAMWKFRSHFVISYVCSVEFMVEKLQSYMDSKILNSKSEHIWVNPDCGLKTRDWKEVIPSLENMVKAAATMRAQVGASA